MRRASLELDFVAGPRRRRVAGIVVLALALAVAGLLASKYRDAQQRLQHLDAAEGLLGAPRSPRVAPRERLEDQVKNAQAVVRQLALPWAELIDSLERSAMREVAVLHVQPDAQQRVIRVTAEARGEAQMLEYLRRVAASGGFFEVHLLSHQVREDDPLHALQFSLQASFRSKP